MDENVDCLRIAARMLIGDPNKAGLLHASLAEELDEIRRLTERADGHLVSRQVIAAVIVNWQERRPNDKPCFPNG